MDRDYIAFISYRHMELDMAIAKKLHTLIEHYKIPSTLRCNGNKQFGIVFRDSEELPVSNDLSSDIRNALDHSRYLIVVCTNNTPESVWVKNEISYFLQNHDRKSVFVVLASGTPEASFPDILIHPDNDKNKTVEPLAANVCAETVKQSLKLLDKEAIRLFAGMLGCPYDDLARREQTNKRKRLFTVFSVASVIVFAFVGLLLYNNWQISQKNIELENANLVLNQQQEEIVAKNAELETANELLNQQKQEISDKNTELEAVNEALSQQQQEVLQKNAKLEAANTALQQQKNELQLNESEMLTNQALAAYDSDDFIRALRFAADALPQQEDDRPYYAPAEKLMLSLLDPFTPNTSKKSFLRTKTIRTEQAIEQFVATDDSRFVLILDATRQISKYHTYTGELCWTTDLNRFLQDPFDFNSLFDQIILDEANDRIFICSNNPFRELLFSISLSDGSVNWQYDNSEYVSYATLTSDRTAIFIWDRKYGIRVLSSETGELLHSIPFNDIYNLTPPFSYLQDGKQIIAVSDDNTTAVVALYRCSKASGQEEYLFEYYKIDLLNETTQLLYRDQVSSNSKISFIKPMWLKIIRAKNSQSGEYYLLKALACNNGILTLCDIDMETGDVLNTSRHDGFDETKVYSCIEETSNQYLLVGYNKEIIAFDYKSNAVLDKVSFSEYILTIYTQKNDPRRFVTVLKNGTHIIGGINSDNDIKADEKRIAIPLCTAESAQIARNGIIDASSSLRLSYGYYTNGYGIIVIKPETTEREINIYYAGYYYTMNEGTQRQVLIPGFCDSDADYLYGLNMFFDTDGTVLVTILDDTNLTQRVLRVDMDTSTIVDCFPSITDQERYNHAAPIVNTPHSMVAQSAHTLLLFENDKRTVLSNSGGIDISSMLQTEDNSLITATCEYKWGDVSSYDNNGRVVTSFLDSVSYTKIIYQHDLLIWVDGKPFDISTIPDENIVIRTADEVTPFEVIHRWEPSVSANGLITLKCVMHDSEQNQVTRYLVYDTKTKDYYKLNDFIGSVPKVMAGAQSKQIAVLDENKTLHIYHLEENQEEQFDIVLNTNISAIEDCRYVLDDKYIIIGTIDGYICVYEVSSGKRVLDAPIDSRGFGYCTRLRVDYSPDKRRIFIVDQGMNNGICIDADTWTVLTYLDNVVAYNPMTDELYYRNRESGTYILLAKKASSREQIIAYANEILRQNREEDIETKGLVVTVFPLFLENRILDAAQRCIDCMGTEGYATRNILALRSILAFLIRYGKIDTSQLYAPYDLDIESILREAIQNNIPFAVLNLALHYISLERYDEARALLGRLSASDWNTLARDFWYSFMWSMRNHDAEGALVCVLANRYANLSFAEFEEMEKIAAENYPLRDLLPDTACSH